MSNIEDPPILHPEQATNTYLFSRGKELAEAGITLPHACVAAFDLPFASEHHKAELFVRYTPNPVNNTPYSVRLAVIKENLTAPVDDPDISYSHILLTPDGRVLDCDAMQIDDTSVTEWLRKQVLDTLVLGKTDMPDSVREGRMRTRRSEFIQPTPAFTTSLEAVLQMVDATEDNITSQFDTRNS